MNTIPDYFAEQLEILFVGFNPSLLSAKTGHHYANPNNRFWKILYRSGLTPRLYSAKEDQDLLSLGYGLTNIVARPTRSAAEITQAEYDQGRQILQSNIEQYRPRIVCFVGKGVYEQYSGRKKLDWGVQNSPVVADVCEFVAPSSSGLVRMKLEDVVGIYQQLNLLLKHR